MAVALKSVSPASFSDTLVGTIQESAEAARFGAATAVRRPMRGFVLAEDTYATLSVDGGFANMTTEEGGLLNSSLRGILKTYTTNFLLQSVTETRNEKVQYVTTFGSTYAFFFGENPRIINCSAVLLNTPDFNWEKEWWVNYEKVLRGSSLTSANSTATLNFDGQTVTGFLTNCTTIKNAQDPYLVNLNFSMFVRSVEYEAGVGATAVYKSPPSTYNVATGSSFESTTAAVRRANIQISALNDSGFSVSSLRGALGAIDGAITNFVRTARNALYGRNLVVPRSFVGERASVPVFPAGTGAEDLAGQSVTTFFGKSVLTYVDGTSTGGGGSTVTLRSNTDGVSFQEYLTDRLANSDQKNTYDNFDEYVQGFGFNSTSGQENVAEFDATAFSSPGQVLNQSAIDAFSAFGLGKAVSEYRTGADVATTSVAQYTAYKQKQRTSSVLRSLARAAFGVATFAYGTSVVNSRREVQESITNPNSGGLDASTIAQLQSEIAESTTSAEQERLQQQAAADALRGNTGTVSPNLISTIGGILT